MVNYIVCLAHFCEAHGPSTIICTERISDKYLDDMKNSNSQKLPLRYTQQFSSSSTTSTCDSCKFKFPGDDKVSRIKQNGSESNKKVSYISSQYPEAERFSAMKKIVMKSLSFETTESSKSMMFGDSLIGYSIVRIFKVKDPTARGGERKYSLIVTSDEESSLVKNWELIKGNFDEILTSINAKIEHTERSKPSNKNEYNESFLRNRPIKPKSLLEIVGDEAFFIKLHMWAVGLLKDLED